MTIKKKLILNIVSVTAIIGAVAATSVIGMGFIKAKLSYLTEHSTPFQIRTVEFQKAIQGATADLVRISASSTKEEYNSSRADSEKSLSEVKRTQDVLESMSGGAGIETYDDLKNIATELFDVSEKRLSAEEEAVAANKTITQKLNEASNRLQGLDENIRQLQFGRQNTFTVALENTKKLSSSMGDLDTLKTSLKELELALVEITKAHDKKTLIISRSKANTVITKALQNKHFLESKKHYGDLKGIGAKIETMVGTQLGLGAQASDQAKNQVERTRKDIGERLSVLEIEVQQELDVMTDKYSSEQNKQGNAYAQTNAANAVLISDSQLVAAGLSIEGLTTRLFNTSSQKEVDALAGQIRRVFSTIDMLEKHLDKLLISLNAQKERTILQSATSSLRTINAMLFAKGGVVEKIRNEQLMKENALTATGKLRDIVMKQAEKSKATVTTAKDEQEKAIVTVNKMVNGSILLIIVISMGAVAIGLAFGGWIFRSIDKPLRRLIEAADDIANGDLSCQLDAGSHDEIGRLTESMNRMVQSFNDVIGKILASVNHNVQVLEVLRKEAQKSSEGSTEQANQAQQIAASAEEMSQTINDIAKNAASASQSASVAKKVAVTGHTAAENAVKAVKNVHSSNMELSATVEELSGKVKEIGEVITIIKDIADQTNLLALNAAIEAARAGEQGRGFAVVADEVRKLAEKTIASTEDISIKIGAVQSETAQTTLSMQTASKQVSNVTSQIKEVGNSLSDIVKAVEEANDQITRIASAMEQQSATSEEVSSNIDKTSQIASQQRESASLVIQEMGGLVNVTEELRVLTTRFKVKGKISHAN